ncbi:hypothetical protein B0J11DRAFT_505914 [Dendryphion nanum]|uniref:Rhodopsin domain-containing protein n=1 Tax=Dendryphion nanum TaxID=256645 RepID=A0A9P9DY47_9PLEO|nr:hypothetical protein B0J11DRAFT_505914 [Dendryphion nanum]
MAILRQIQHSSTMYLMARAGSVTADDKSTAVMIATWVTLAVVVIMFISRQGIRYMQNKKVTVDDVFIFLATTFAIGLSVTTLVLASQGLGVREQLTTPRANILMKAHYASDFLYVLSICFPKLTLVAFFHRIVVQRAERRITQVFGIFIIAWTLASLAAVAFQCSLPRPWEMMTLRCYNKGIFWIVYCIIDMTTEVGLVMLSVNLVAYLRVRLSRKLIVVACFAPRILVIVAALARLVFLFPITPHDNPEFNLWIPVVCTQVHVCLSIATACIPYIKPIFEALDGSDARRRKVSSTRNNVEAAYLQGHRKGAEVYSFDSTPSLKYNRTPDVSPRVPSLAPLSPLTPPRYNSPAASSKSPSSRSPSERGLKLQIPPSLPQPTITTELISPQTASSYALSPECLSPQPLLSPLSPVREPSPPPRSHSPRPHARRIANANPTSPGDANILTPPLPSKTVFPRIPRVPSASYSLIPQITPTPPPTIPLPQKRQSRSPNRRVSIHRMKPNSSRPRQSASIEVAKLVQIPQAAPTLSVPERGSSKEAHAHPLHRYRAHYAAANSPPNSSHMSPVMSSAPGTPSLSAKASSQSVKTLPGTPNLNAKSSAQSMSTARGTPNLHSKSSSQSITPAFGIPNLTSKSSSQSITSAPALAPKKKVTLQPLPCTTSPPNPYKPPTPSYAPPPHPSAPAIRPPPRTSSLQTHHSHSGPRPKFSTAPNPTRPSPTVTIPTTYAYTPSPSSSQQHQRSASSTVPSYYINTPPTTSPPTFPLPSPPMTRVRNGTVLSPVNSSRGFTSPTTGTMRSPISPPLPTPGSEERRRRYSNGRGRFPVSHGYGGSGGSGGRGGRSGSGSVMVTSPLSAGSMMRSNRPWEVDEGYGGEGEYAVGDGEGEEEGEVLMRAGSEEVRSFRGGRSDGGVIRGRW